MGLIVNPTIQFAPCGKRESLLQQRRRPEIIVSALCAVAEPAATRFLWRPQLHDPADEMVLETAINGGAEALVTFNRRDFGLVPERFGVSLLSPQEALRKVPT